MTQETQPLDTDALDTGAVARWLAGRLPGFEGPLRAEKFATGQSNPTYRLVTPAGCYVLRRKPPGALLKSAHAVEREYRVQRALADSAVPVPRMHALCEDSDVIGTPFYVMEEVAGRTFDDPRLPDLSPGERHAVIDEMNRVLAAIHSVDIEAAGLADYGPEGNYYRRQIDRWTKQYRASETDRVPAMDDLIAWLDANAPEDDGRRTLVHGDFRIDNLLFAEAGTDCVAVIDWELSTLGHPFADLAAVIMQWRRPAGAEGRGLAGVDRVAHGLMTDEEFIAAYCRRTGLEGIERFGFYLAFCFFRLAAILQGVKRRALDGNASNPERALTVGAHVPAIAAAGLEAARED
jgi:aminoglycoside phosphotransferase (APT) family kinase protein